MAIRQLQYSQELERQLAIGQGFEKGHRVAMSKSLVRRKKKRLMKRVSPKVELSDTIKKERFRQWAKKYKIKNPDDPRHFYDYRAAYKAGIVPKKWKDLAWKDKMEDVSQMWLGERPPFNEEAYMWPDKFKLKEHPIPSKEI